MTNFDGNEITIPVRLDASQIAADLRTVDAEVAKLERRLVRAFNSSDLVGTRKNQFNPAKTAAEVQENLRALPASQVRQLLPGVAQTQDALNARLGAIERQARAGRGVLPPTEQQAARQRLAGVERQNRPVQVEMSQSSIDKFGRSLMRHAGPNLAGMMMARGRIGGASSMVRMLLSAAEGDPLLMAAIGAPLIAAGGALAINQNQTTFQRNAAALASATIGGPMLNNQRAMYGLGLSGISSAFSVPGSDVTSMSQSMAFGGINRQNLLNDVRNAIMLAGPNQLPYGDVSQIVTALGTTGGLSSGGINQTFQDLQNVAHDSGVSIQQLVASMKALSTTAVGSARDVGGLAAVQALIGPGGGINAGQLLAPTLGATGGQAMQAAALLGLSPQQLLSAQSSRGGTALLFDRMSALVKRVGRGPAGTDVAEQLLTSTGLINPQAISSPQQFAQLIQTMMSGSPQQAEQAAQRLYSKASTQHVPQQQSYDDAAAAMRRVTPLVDRFGDTLQYWINVLNNSPVGTTSQQAWRTYNGLNPSTTQQQARLRMFEEQGMNVPNGLGSTNYLSPQLLGLYEAYSKQYGVPLSFMLAQGSLESGFNPDAVSKAGAQGIAQFMPATAKAYGVSNPFDPAQAIAGQARMDRANYKKYGSWQAAAEAYNPGDPNYGATVMKGAAATQHELTVTVVIKDQSGKVVQTQVDHHRVVAGHVSHGPPALPHRRS